MACRDYGWKPIEHQGILDVVKWFQNKFDLRDWEIMVDTNTNVPEKFKEDEASEKVLARCEAATRRHMAILWMPLNRLKINDVNAEQTVIHELLHIFCSARHLEVDLDSDDNIEECIVYGLEAPIFELYCRERRVKLPKFRQCPWKKIQT